MIKKSFLLIFLTFCVVSLYANEKVHTVLVLKDWKPYYSLDKQGKPTGYAIELFEAVAKDIGLQYQYKVFDNWVDMTVYRQTNNEYIIPNTGIVKDRLDYTKYSETTDTLQIKYFKRTSSHDIKTKQNLKEKNVAIVKKNICTRLPHHKEIKKVIFEDYLQALSALLSGEVDAICYPKDLLNYSIENLDLSDKIVSFGAPLYEVKRAFGFSNNNAHLVEKTNTAFEKLKENRVYEKIYRKWFTYPEENYFWYIIKWVSIVSFIFIVILSFVLHTNRKLNQEIDKRKKSEELLKATNEKLTGLYKMSPLGIALTDSNGKFVEFNAAFETICGYTQEELKTLDYWKLTPKKYEKEEQKLLELLSKTGHYGPYEKEYIQKNGNIIPINLNGMLITSDDGAQYTWSIIEDISERKRTEKTILEQSKMASMGEMIGNISHQWRQPLSVISTASTGMLLQKEYNTLSDDEFKKTCNLINENSQYLSKTIDDFRNFIKGDREKSIFYLEKSVSSFLNLVDGSIKTHNLEIHLDLQKDLTINGYENELAQCLINIFNNAKDVLLKEEITEKLLFITAFKSDDKAIIAIKDNGGGVPKDILSRVFEPYFTTKHQTQGTGLGLSMTYKLIVDGMDGTIELQNVSYIYKGKNYTGAQFTITLPLS